MAEIASPQFSSSAMTTTCGNAITAQASLAAFAMPSVTGSERTPIAVSPSTALKSLRVMMPCAPML